MDLLCPRLRARLEGKEYPVRYGYGPTEGEMAEKRGVYGKRGMGVPIRQMKFASDEEAARYLKACIYLPR